MKVKYNDQEIEIPENATIEVVNGDFVIIPKNIKKNIGDFLYLENDDGYSIAIYENFDLVNELLLYYACIEIPDNELSIDGMCDNRVVRLATEEEKQNLLDALHKDGKDWDAENKQIVNYRWRAKNGEKYFYINTNYMYVNIVSDDLFNVDNGRYKNGNYFKTKQQAEQALEKIKELLKSIK